MEVLPSWVIGIPVMALMTTFSYPQSFPGPTAPHSYATRDLGAEIALARIARVWARFLSSSPPPMNIAVFAWAQSVSPAETVPVFFAIAEMSDQMSSMSMDPRQPIA